jgi:hypothetical protein
MSDYGEILIEWVGFDRILRPKIAAGDAIKARVIYDGGSFDLVFVVEKLPSTKAGIQEQLSRLISQFADHLKDASQRQIRINIPDPPERG